MNDIPNLWRNSYKMNELFKRHQTEDLFFFTEAVQSWRRFLVILYAPGLVFLTELKLHEF